MKMNLLLNLILQEKQRIDYMLERYQEELAELPKGTIAEKKVNGKTYFYLKYRDGRKVVSQYVSKRNLEDLQKKLEKRKHIEAMIQSLEEEKRIAVKVLEG